MGMLMIGLLVGCNSKSNDDKSAEKSKVVKEVNKEVPQNDQKAEVKQEESKYPFPTVAAQTGDATITIVTPSGDSSNGNTPVLFVKPTESLIQIGANLDNFQGDKQTFIFIDKFYDSTEQVGERSQMSLDLADTRLKTGVHTVTTVQFENDDPTGNVLNFVEAKYEVKEAK
jgi:hypothetical protein